MSTDRERIRRTYRRGRGGDRSWIVIPSGHLYERQRDAALHISELGPGSNPLIQPHRLTLSVHGAAQITLDVEQLRALLDEVDPA